MERIRILQLIDGVAIGDQSGGAESHAVEVARHLDRSDYEPAIFAAWGYGSQTERHWLELLSREEINVQGLISQTNSFRRDFARVVRGLWTSIRHFKPHIVHSHSERFDSLNVLMRIFHPARPAAVRTIQIDRQWQTHPHIGPFINSKLFPFLFNFEIAVSQHIYQELQNSRFHKEDKISLCYNGIDAAAFNKQPGMLPDYLSTQGPRIGIAARLSDQKGHADLICAFQMVNRQNPAHLIIAGDGPLMPDLKKLSERLELSNNVHFLGTRNDVWDILPHLDLFVLPSYYEGFPIVLIETMSQSVPVIATDITGTRELIKDGITGLLVPPGQPDRLAEKMLDALNDPYGSKIMAQRAKEFASQFTIQNVAKCYESCYQRLVHQS